MSVVPAVSADPRPDVPAEILAGPGQESVLLAANGPFPLMEIDKPTLLLSSAEDALIIGLAAATMDASGTTTPTPDNPHPLLRQAYDQTAATVVWALLADANHSSFGVSGGYWWPQLKPERQKRFFEPEKSFKLIAPESAHRMQQELALAFFDLTIRQDESAKERLLQNRYESQGLVLESRNL